MRTICGAVYLTWYTLADNCVDSAVQFKDGISGGESIQTEPDGDE